MAVARLVRPTYETLTFTAPQSSNAFDPHRRYAAARGRHFGGQQTQAEGKRYFDGRGITHLEVTGNDSGHDLLITLRIAYDPEAGLLFSFLDASD